MRRAPARPVRALCEPVARLLHKNMTCARPRCDATPSKHFLHTSRCTLHTPHFTLHTCASRSTLHLISNHVSTSHLISPHLIPSLLTCYLDKFFSTVFISSDHWSTFLIPPKLFSTHLSCSARQKALTLTKKSLAQNRHWAQRIFPHRSLRHRCIYIGKPLQDTLYYKACTKHFPVLLCTTKLAQSKSQYYFVLQSLHKVLPSASLYNKACTKHIQVLLCTPKLAQSTSQHYFVLQCLHKALPSFTSYYKACTKHVPVLLCTTKLAQSTSLYYSTMLAQSFVLQSLHKVLFSTNYFVLQSLHKASSSTTL